MAVIKNHLSPTSNRFIEEKIISLNLCLYIFFEEESVVYVLSCLVSAKERVLLHQGSIHMDVCLFFK